MCHDRVHHLGHVVLRKSRQPAYQSVPPSNHRQCADSKQNDDDDRDRWGDHLLHGNGVRQLKGGNGVTLVLGGVTFAQIAPVVLVAYITTMLSADIRFALAKIKRVSETDELTGVYNMRAFTAILKRSLQQSIRHTHPLSIIMVDADDLKSINDSFGHDAGDKLLKHLISKFADELRQSDVLARYGGDEFTILLPETGLSGATEVAERMRKSVELSRFDVRGKADLATTISIGIASFPEHGSNGDLIFEKADKALYRAKREGRNRIAIYELEKDAR